MAHCKHCGGEFVPRKRYGHDGQPDQMFCCRACYFAYKKAIGNSRVTVTCAKCGRQFKRWPSQLSGERNYCSKRCANSANHPSNRPREYLPPETKLCENCGAEFKVWPYRARQARFCSRGCAYEARTTTTPKARDNGLRNMPHRCMVCGFDVTVAVHHIIPRREGGRDSIDNLVVLCPNHHAMADRNLISRDTLTALSRAAVAQLSASQHQSHLQEPFAPPTSDTEPLSAASEIHSRSG